MVLLIVPVKPSSHLFDAAQSFTEEMDSVELDKRTGFIDKKGSMIIPARYKYASSFANGISAVRINNKWGFINKTGKEIVPAMFDNIERLENDQFKNTFNGEIHYFDSGGNRITK